MVTAIKLLHTVIWALLAGSIVAIPFLAKFRRFRWVAILSVLVLAECMVLALNGGRCPLTDMAEQFTTNRADNFDIYLPNWLARYNKDIFGTLFVAGELIALRYWFKHKGAHEQDAKSSGFSTTTTEGD
jgi:hypothetical protein